MGIAALLSLCASTYAADVSASGGFFCKGQPVTQSAERILFEVGEGTVRVTTQLSFSGPAADFAWVLPLAEVPDPDSLAVLSPPALHTLDSSSAPTFPLTCPGTGLGTGCPECAPVNSGDGEIDVYLRAEVGAYDVSVVGAENPAALVQWLRDAGYRITPPMAPYIAAYADEGMKFLALKLRPSAGVQDIRPFRFSVPGTTPSIALRMTALAAEPEMSVLAFVLGSQRYEGKNWPNLEIPGDQLRHDPFLPSQTNWSTLVAKAVDEAGGQGWVTEYAGPSSTYAESLRAQLENGDLPTPEARQSMQELLSVLERYPYLTRLYTRLSAEEMTLDPILGQSALGEVSGQHPLAGRVPGIEQCTDEASATDPCDFTTCGAAGLCRTTNTYASNGQAIPGCACLPGATARTTLAPDGSPTVLCQDARLSFLNPGDRERVDFETLPDVCASFSCGEHGQCLTMNLTPTCLCEQGFVATASLADDGTRQMTCVEPLTRVPLEFYQARLPALPEQLPGGREVRRSAPPPAPEDDTPDLPNAGLVTGETLGGGACALSLPWSVPSSGAPPRWLALGVLAAGLRCRRRRDTPRLRRKLWFAPGGCR